MYEVRIRVYSAPHAPRSTQSQMMKLPQQLLLTYSRGVASVCVHYHVLSSMDAMVSNLFITFLFILKSYTCLNYFYLRPCNSFDFHSLSQFLEKCTYYFYLRFYTHKPPSSMACAMMWLVARLGSNHNRAMSEGCFIFHFALLDLEVTRPIQSIHYAQKLSGRKTATFKLFTHEFSTYYILYSYDLYFKGLIINHSNIRLTVPKI